MYYIPLLVKTGPFERDSRVSMISCLVPPKIAKIGIE